MKRGLAFLPLQFCIRRKALHEASASATASASASASALAFTHCNNNNGNDNGNVRSKQVHRHFSVAKPPTYQNQQHQQQQQQREHADSLNSEDEEILSIKSNIDNQTNRHHDRDHPFLDPENKYLRVLQQTNKNSNTKSSNNKQIIQIITLAASRHGTPSRFHQPIVYHPNYSFPEWPTKQTFPMSKFYHLAQTLTTKLDHLPRPLVRNHADFYQPLQYTDIPEAWFAQPHGPINPTFLHRFLAAQLDHKEERLIGFRECTKWMQLRERTVLEVAGTVLACQLAYQYGMATNAAGGTHHAHSDMGAGYTILNDLAIAANFLLKEDLNGGTIKGVKTVLVVDGDVHQGDGTAKFHNVPGLGLGLGKDDGGLVTLSLHCDSNYPQYKAHSTYDVPLPDKMGDEEYMDAFVNSVTRAMEESNPDFVLYDAGVDVHKDDFLGRLSLTEEGIRKRDRWMFEVCVREGIPICGVIGGGYDKDPDTLAKRHSIVHEEAARVWRNNRLYSQ